MLNFVAFSSVWCVKFEALDVSIFQRIAGTFYQLTCESIKYVGFVGVLHVSQDETW